MRNHFMSRAALMGGAVCMLVAAESAQAQELLANGNLDKTYQQEINPPAPGFFLPKPDAWVNTATKGGGAWEDEMSSEPWAGPAPTPVTADGVDPDGPGGNPGDWAVFFKPFGGTTAEPVTGHLYQDKPAVPGATYTLRGWAGAEANYLAQQTVFAIDFLNAVSTKIGGSELDLVAAGLLTPNGEAFNYKQFSLDSVAPAGTTFVRARVSMIGATSNPLGGGQAFVVDDFSLVPEPTAASLLAMGCLAPLARRRRSR
jgi:hypothetical protein